MRAGIDGNDNRQRLRREVSRGYVHNDLCKEVKQRGVVYLHTSAYVSIRQHICKEVKQRGVVYLQYISLRLNTLAASSSLKLALAA